MFCFVPGGCHKVSVFPRGILNKDPGQRAQLFRRSSPRCTCSGRREAAVVKEPSEPGLAALFREAAAGPRQAPGLYLTCSWGWSGGWGCVPTLAFPGACPGRRSPLAFVCWNMFWGKVVTWRLALSLFGLELSVTEKDFCLHPFVLAQRNSIERLQTSEALRLSWPRSFSCAALAGWGRRVYQQPSSGRPAPRAPCSQCFRRGGCRSGSPRKQPRGGGPGRPAALSQGQGCSSLPPLTWRLCSPRSGFSPAPRAAPLFPEVRGAAVGTRAAAPPPPAALPRGFSGFSALPGSPWAWAGFFPALKASAQNMNERSLRSSATLSSILLTSPPPPHFAKKWLVSLGE